MPEAHSKYSASGFEAAALCPGKPVMEHGKPNTSSKYADEGTAAHTLLEQCLTTGKPALAFRGDRIPVGTATWEVTEEMAAAVQTAIDNIHQIAGPDGMILAEQKVVYATYLGVPDDEGWGTSDVIAARGEELQVHDYKHGMGVQVSAGEDVVDAATGAILQRKPNTQMALYGLGALLQCQGILGDFQRVRLVIHQPRITEAPSEYVVSVNELETWSKTARSAVASRRNAWAIATLSVTGDAEVPGQTKPLALEGNQTFIDTFLRPGEKQCKFCKAKATCPALRNEALAPVLGQAPATADEFADATVPAAKHIAPATDQWLGAVLAKADLIDDWLAAVRAEALRRLAAGQAVPGFKLVQGKRGNRAWANPAEAEKLLRDTFRLKTEEAYDLKLISPTSAEKLHKAGVIGPRQWPKAQALITQPDGKPSVAPASDPRPALDVKPVADEFEAMPEVAGAEFA